MAFSVALSGATAKAQELAIWHDLGDNGNAWFQKAGEAFAKTRPGVSIKPSSFPTDQWFGRVIGAINTDSAPALIYNNYERVIRIQSQTGKVMDLKSTLGEVKDKDFLLEDDLKVATYAGKMIILPIQRVQMGFGVRKSWLDKVGEKFPETWADVQRVSVKFRDNDPDGNGKADTYGMALEAAKPRDLIHILDLFIFGSGLRATLVDAKGDVIIDQPAHAQVLEEILKALTVYG
jgi:ABC-type glycerol-3-phosphate transport system substrate-binding protein